ncbi:MAG: hypothetical protein BWY83_00355 [bacterium ADurb.Bin478]|nr:MAG: hypothetical protein BWY83_00355 [bacterium ADurb.Bin478]
MFHIMNPGRKGRRDAKLPWPPEPICRIFGTGMGDALHRYGPGLGKPLLPLIALRTRKRDILAPSFDPAVKDPSCRQNRFPERRKSHVIEKIMISKHAQFFQFGVDAIRAPAIAIARWHKHIFNDQTGNVLQHVYVNSAIAIQLIGVFTSIKLKFRAIGKTQQLRDRGFCP